MEVIKIFFPELFLATASLFLLIINSFAVKRSFLKYLSFLSLFVLSLVILLLSNSSIPPQTEYSQTFLILKSHYLFRIILFVFGIVLYISLYRFLIQERYLNEFSFFLGAVLSFLSLMTASQNLLLAFLLMEAISFGFYLLLSFYRRNLLCLEAGLKYFFLGTLSSIFFFTGLFLIYYSSLEINLFQALAKVASFKMGYFTLGLILIFSSLAFKLGASPFHFWLPEVYQGSPLPVFPILIAFSKLAFAVFLSNLVLVSLNSGWIYLPKEALYGLFYLLSISSMVIGNFLALKQRELKRLLAYSSISHVGYLLTMFAIPWSMENLKIYYGYIFIYALTNFGIFLALATLIDFKQIKIPVDTFKDNLKNQNFLILLSLLVILFSLAGLPPSAGFVTKFFLLLEIVKQGSYILALVLLSTSLLSLYYYFRLINPLLAVLKEGLVERSYEKTDLNEIFITLVITAISLYLFFSTFKPSFIFFFN